MNFKFITKPLRQLQTRVRREKCQFKAGDKVKCYYGNSGNKWWTHILEPYAIINKIKYDKHSGLYKLRFDGEDYFFYENDFYLA